MKYKNIELDGLDIEIDIEAAKGFIDHRINMKCPLTPRAFYQAMNESLRAFEVGMTPTELIDWTVTTKGWKGINIAYTKNALAGEFEALKNVARIEGRLIQGESTRDIPTQQMLDDKSWAN